MLLLRGEARKVIEFKSKSGKELYKLKIELERFDAEVFIPSKFYNNIDDLKNMIGKQIDLPVYLNIDLSEDKTKVYRNYVLASFPQEIN